MAHNRTVDSVWARAQDLARKGCPVTDLEVFFTIFADVASSKYHGSKITVVVRDFIKDEETDGLYLQVIDWRRSDEGKDETLRFHAYTIKDLVTELTSRQIPLSVIE